MNFFKRVWQTYQKGKKYSDVKTELKRVRNRLNAEENETTSLVKQVDELQRALKEARHSIKELKDADSSPNPEDLKNFFMYPGEQNSWEYPIRGGADVPVSQAFKYSDDEVIDGLAQEVVKKGGLRRKNNPTQVADYFYRYVDSNWEWDYTRDSEKFGQIEFWQAPDKSAHDREGDCDDLTLLMHVVLRRVLEMSSMGGSVWRVRLATSRTLSGGHAYNIWLAEDCEWYVMESTMDMDGSLERTWLETPLRQNNFYYDFYGFATPEQTWRGDLDSIQPADDEVKAP